MFTVFFVVVVAIVAIKAFPAIVAAVVVDAVTTVATAMRPTSTASLITIRRFTPTSDYSPTQIYYTITTSPSSSGTTLRSRYRLSVSTISAK